MAATKKTKSTDIKPSDMVLLQKQWRKLSGLHGRGEWSAAITRAATAAELSANIAIRFEFESRSTFDRAFVDSLLKSANGLAGKVDRLLIPLVENNTVRAKVVKKLVSISKTINSKRNAVVHQGEFCNEVEADEIISAAREFISVLLCIYYPDFALRERAP